MQALLFSRQKALSPLQPDVPENRRAQRPRRFPPRCSHLLVPGEAGPQSLPKPEPDDLCSGSSTQEDSAGMCPTFGTRTQSHHWSAAPAPFCPVQPRAASCVTKIRLRSAAVLCQSGTPVRADSGFHPIPEPAPAGAGDSSCYQHS